MYDYVIVGGGSAGCVLAARLSEDPHARVLLLEAGPRDRRMEIRIPAAFSKLFKTPLDWDYATDPERELAGRALYWPRGRTLGGSSSINAQMWVRGNAADFDGWAALGNAGWGFADVLPYFRRSERCARRSELRGADGPVCVSELRDPNPATHAFVAAAVEAGIPRCDDVNGACQDGVDYTQVTQLRGRRCSAADAYLRPALRRANLRVETGAHATRVLLDGPRATGVEYVRDGRVERVAAGEVVLAAGAVNSPQLLMLSGIGPAAELAAHGVPVRHDLPGVGRNLQDHLVAGAVVAARRPITLAAAESPGQLLRYLFLRRGMLTSNVAEACAFVRSGPDVRAPDLELIFAPVRFEDHGLTRPTEHGLSLGVVLLQPESRGAVGLRSADPLARPRIVANYLSDPAGEDLRRVLHGMRLVRRVLGMPALSSLVGDPVRPGPEVRDDAALERFVRENAETLYHPVGTCRMGVDDAAVVDPSLRVRGVDGLRVVDASVMPTIVRGHTNAPTIMIAERGADLIRASA